MNDNASPRRIMRNCKPTRLRSFLTRSLAIGTTFLGGSFFTTINAADDNASQPKSSRRVATAPDGRFVGETSSSRDADAWRQKRVADEYETQRPPLPFKPPIIVQTQPQEGAQMKPRNAESISGVWIPRGRAQSMMPNAENRFTPWTTPNIDRVAPKSPTTSGPPSATLDRPHGSIEANPNSTDPPSIAPGKLQPELMIISPRENDPTTTPPSSMSTSRDSFDERIREENQVQSDEVLRSETRLRTESETQTETETQTRTETTTETRVQSRIAMLRESDESRERRTAEAFDDTFASDDPSTSSSEPLQLVPPSDAVPTYESDADADLQELSSEVSSRADLEELSPEDSEPTGLKPAPMKRPDSNEPTQDIVEPDDADALSSEAQTDGDIDAESLARLRAAIRSFPDRRARQLEDQTLSPSDQALATDASTESAPSPPQTLQRQPLVIKPEVQAMKASIARVLIDFHRRPENAAGRSPWGTFHLMLPFGADANVRSGNRLFNSIAWLSSNRPCRGQRLITTTQSGRIYVRQGPGLQGHRAQFLAMLAQVNVEATYPLTDGRNRFTVEDLIRAEMADCRRGEELTFALIGLSHYLPTDTHWKASDGSTWNFETLIAEELAHPIVGAACGGTHRLMGLSYALRQRRMEGLPISGQWARAEAFINDFVEYAWSLQNRDGSFSTKWFEGPEDNRDIERKIQTTGHILEWLIFVADQQQLQDPRYIRSVQFLTNTFTRYRTREWDPGPKGHVLRALSVYHRRVYGDARPWATASQTAQPRTRSYR
ncbi:MAG: hypothetical protein R3C05_18025 [Pirellulaceae bacterium]